MSIHSLRVCLLIASKNTFKNKLEPNDFESLMMALECLEEGLITIRLFVEHENTVAEYTVSLIYCFMPVFCIKR